MPIGAVAGCGGACRALGAGGAAVAVLRGWRAASWGAAGARAEEAAARRGCAKTRGPCAERPCAVVLCAEGLSTRRHAASSPTSSCEQLV